jgi:transposase
VHGTARPEPLSARAVIDVAGRVISKVAPREGAIIPLRLVEHRNMWRDALLLDPVIHGTTASEAAMTGRQPGDQTSLFYEFRLDDRIPKEHLLRRINLFLTPVLGGTHEQLAPYHSEIGRPSIDPELMIRVLIVVYCYGLRPERKLTQEVELHLAYRWFCRLDLDRIGTTRRSRRTGSIGFDRAMSFTKSSSESSPPA